MAVILTSIGYQSTEVVTMNTGELWFLFASVYKHGLRLSSSMGGNILIMLNARNEHDRTKFVDDLKESILEVGLQWF